MTLHVNWLHITSNDFVFVCECVCVCVCVVCIYMYMHVMCAFLFVPLVAHKVATTDQWQ